MRVGTVPERSAPGALWREVARQSVDDEKLLRAALVWVSIRHIHTNFFLRLRIRTGAQPLAEPIVGLRHLQDLRRRYW